MPHRGLSSQTLTGEPLLHPELSALAARLVGSPFELRMTPHGVTSGRELLGWTRLSGRLAKRRVRSLLARSASAMKIEAALAAALTVPPADAAETLEDAALEVNLREGLHASPDATLRLEGATLVIEDEAPPAIVLSRSELDSRGRRYFAASARARLADLGVETVRFSESAVLPTVLQVAPAAAMGLDLVQEPLRAGRMRRLARFEKVSCHSCGRCFVHCPHNAILHARYDSAAPETTGILGVDSQRCTGCGICAAVCPPDGDGHAAIVMMDGFEEDGAEERYVA